jgi:hypothetical protein
MKNNPLFLVIFSFALINLSSFVVTDIFATKENNLLLQEELKVVKTHLQSAYKRTEKYC